MGFCLGTRVPQLLSTLTWNKQLRRIHEEPSPDLHLGVFHITDTKPVYLAHLSGSRLLRTGTHSTHEIAITKASYAGIEFSLL